MIGTIASTAMNMMTGGYRPPVGFFFRAGFLEQMAMGAAGALAGLDLASDSKFQEISGISMSLDTEELVEGGNNEFVYKLPKQTKYENLVMKRGLVTNGSDFSSWCQDTIRNGFTQKISKRSLFVELMSPNSMIPLMFWSFENAFPVKWEISGFNSQESAIVTETLEFTYERMTIIPMGAASAAAALAANALANTAVGGAVTAVAKKVKDDVTEAVTDVVDEITTEISDAANTVDSAAADIINPIP